MVTMITIYTHVLYCLSINAGSLLKVVKVIYKEIEMMLSPTIMRGPPKRVFYSKLFLR